MTVKIKYIKDHDEKKSMAATWLNGCFYRKKWRLPISEWSSIAVRGSDAVDRDDIISCSCEKKMERKVFSCAALICRWYQGYRGYRARRYERYILVNAVWLSAQVGIVPASLMLINVCDKCHQGDLDLIVMLMVSFLILILMTVITLWMWPQRLTQRA